MRRKFSPYKRKMFKLSNIGIFPTKSNKALGEFYLKFSGILIKRSSRVNSWFCHLQSLFYLKHPTTIKNCHFPVLKGWASLNFLLTDIPPNLTRKHSGLCSGPNYSGEDLFLGCLIETIKKPICLIIGQMTANNSIIKTSLRILFALIQLVIKALLWPIYGGPGEKVPPITDLLLLDSATTLAHKIRTKKVTSVEVVTSFINRIKSVNPILNCVVDERFEDALNEARAVDELISSGRKTKEELEEETPFLGVPFTTKDCIGVKGMSCTAGLYRRKNMKASEDADVIGLMRKAGAIPLAITNVSELCFWWEGVNPVYGRTNNYYNTNHIVGGSSSGEGCLLSSGGSAMGIGSDIGGSVRIPSFFNGVFGHKPSTGVGSLKGHYPLPSNNDQKSFLVIGPMSRFAKDLLPMLKIMAPEHVGTLKLNEPVDPTKLKYYYMDDDTGGLLISSVDGEIKNSIQKINNYFKTTHDITVQKVNLQKLRYSMALWFAKMTVPEGPQMPAELANHEGVVNVYKEILRYPFAKARHTFPLLCVALVERFNANYGSPKHKFFLDLCAELKKEFQDLLGNNGVFIYPTHPTAAPYHVEPLFKPLNVAYTAVFNVLGFPATHVPLGLNSKGLPIGIQVVGNINQDRLTLAVALELEKAFGGWVPASRNI